MPNEITAAPTNADVPHPQDQVALQQRAADPATRASDMLSANPELAKAPATAHALLSTPYGDGNTLGQSGKFLSAYGDTHTGYSDAIKSTPNPSARGWLGSLLHGASSVWNDAANVVGGGSMAVVHGLEDAPGAIGAAAENIGKGIIPAAKRYFQTTTELGSFGQVGLSYKKGQAVPTINAPEDNRATLANYVDGVHTVANVANNTVNPFTVYRNMAHTIAFTESLAKRRGAAYAFAYMLPYLALGFATHSVVAGAGDVSAASEITNLATEAEAQGATLTPEEEAAAQAAKAAETAPRTVTVDGQPTTSIPFEPRGVSDVPVEPNAAEAAAQGAARGPLFQMASRAAGLVSKPLAPVMRIAGAIAKPAADVRLNGMYAAAGFGIRQDPTLAPLWESTRNGVPIDENGKPMSNVGSVIADYLGLPAGFFHAAIADPIDIYANYLGADPLGAYGKMVGRARSFEGMGGIMSRFFGGMGLRAPEDVYRTAQQYSRVSAAFRWMADHNAGQINETFKGLFKGEQGATVLHELGSASTPQDVMKIWADMVKGETYFHNVAPSMTSYELMKATYKFGDNYKQVGQALTESADALHAEAADIKKATGYVVWPPDAANYALAIGGDGARIRERTLMGQLFTKFLSSKPMYFNETTAKLENFTIDTHSLGTSHAVGSQLRELGQNEATIADVTSRLQTATEDEYNNLVKNAYYDALMRLTFAGTKESVTDSVKVQLSQDIATEIERMVGPDGAGEKGTFVNGLEGERRSWVPVNGDIRNAGIGETHLGQLHFPQTRDLRGFAKYVRRIAIEHSGVIDGAKGVDAHLSIESLEKKAAYADAHLRELAPRIDTMYGKVIPEVVDANPGVKGLRQIGYNSKVREIADEIRTSLRPVATGDTIGHNQAFVDTFSKVRDDLARHESVVALGDQYNVIRHTFDDMTSDAAKLAVQELDGHLPEGSPFESVSSLQTPTLEKLRGETLALQDAMAEFTPRLSKPAISIEDIRAHIAESEPTLSPHSAEKLARSITRLRDENPHYRNGYQSFIDKVNWYYSKVFVPMALYSGGWAIRVGNSEMLLNTFRQGGMSMLQSKLLTSYVKHETGKAVFTNRAAAIIAKWSAKEISESQLNFALREVDRATGSAHDLNTMTVAEKRAALSPAKLLTGKGLLEGTMGDMLKRTDLSYDQKLRSSAMRTTAMMLLQARDLAGGTLHGIEGNLIHWTPRTQRMLDNFTSAINDFAPGGLPMGVHSGGGIIEPGSMKSHLLFGEDSESGKTIMSTTARNRTFKGVSPEDKNYVRGLRGSIVRIHDDKYLKPSMDRLAVILRDAGEKSSGATPAHDEFPNDLAELIHRGAPRYHTQAQIDGLLNELTDTAMHTIERQSPEELSRFARHTNEGTTALPHDEVLARLNPAQREAVVRSTPEEQAVFFAHYDWARNIAYHDLHTVTGTLGDGEYLLHPSLVYEASSGDVRGLAGYRRLVHEMPDHMEPRNIVAESYKGADAEGMASAVDLPQRISDYGFRKALGPVVNSYVRDPLYLTIFDEEMEKLEGMKNALLIDRESQMLRAHQNAIVKMARFVHNPMDRTIFESNMRAYAPFYFAQNQAWRRALRVWRDDPGAFEKYVRASLATTNFVSIQGKGGAAPVRVPGTEFMGPIAGLGSGLQPNQLGSLGFSLAAGIGSVSSVIPTGSEGGLGVLETVSRPSWGPLVTLVLKEAEHYLGLGHLPFATKVINGILGPVSSNSSISSELFPSTFGRGVLATTEGLFQFNEEHNTSFASAQIYVLNNAVDNLAGTFYKKGLALAAQAGLTAGKAETVARAYSDKEVAQYLDVNTNRAKVQQFMDQVHMSAVYLFAVKTMLSFGSPLALSLQESFSKDPQFQALLNDAKPDGSKKYSYEQAATLFAERYPSHIYDLVAHSKPIGTDYPETVSAMNLLQNHSQIVTKYPNAAAYLIDRSTAYSPQAYQLELAMRLRERYGLTGGSSGYGDYYEALLNANGNDFYYNWLKPQYNTDLPGAEGYKNYKSLDAASKQYGTFSNPTWYGNFKNGSGKWAVEAQALGQMGAMLADRSVPDSVYGGTDSKALYSVLMDAYNVAAHNYQTAVTSKQRYNIESSWYQQMTNLSTKTDAKGNLVLPPALGYFVTGVLRNLPTAKE